MSCTASVAGFELITEGLVNSSTQKPGGAIEFLFVSPIRPLIQAPKNSPAPPREVTGPPPNPTERRECLSLVLRQRFVAPLTG